MDSIDIFVCSLALLFIVYQVIQLGTECAQKVWDRTKQGLDDIDLIEAAHVPATNNVEAIVIFVAATLRGIFMLPVKFYDELMLRDWERTPEMRNVYSQISLGNNVLGAVATMLTGFPERAEILFFKERIARIRLQLEAQAKDYESLHGAS